MISMLSLWESVRDLTRKDHAGYTSKEEFNRLVNNQAQQDLFEYYISVAGINSRARMALQPFIVEATLTQTLPQYYNLPSDFRYPLNAGAVVLESGCDPIIENYPSDHWSSDEDLLSLRSPIRKPSIAKRKFAHEFLTGKLKSWPKEFTGRYYLKYYKTPPTATLGYTLNTSTQEEEHNAGTTVDLAWPTSETQNFIDLLLLYKGVILTKGDLVNWVQAKKSLNSLPESVRDINTRQI